MPFFFLRVHNFIFILIFIDFSFSIFVKTILVWIKFIRCIWKYFIEKNSYREFILIFPEKQENIYYTIINAVNFIFN